MANPHRGEFNLQCGNVVYTLAVDYDVLCQIETAIGRGMPAIAMELGDPQKITLTNIRKIMHLLLKRRHPDLTELEAGEIIAGAGGAIAVINVIGDAIQMAFPIKSDDATDPTRPDQTMVSIGPVH